MDRYIQWLDLGSTPEDFESLTKDCREMECLVRSRSKHLQLAAKRYMRDEDPEQEMMMYKTLFKMESKIFYVGSIFEGLNLAVSQRKSNIDRTREYLKELRKRLVG